MSRMFHQMSLLAALTLIPLADAGCALEEEFACPITTHTGNPGEAFLEAPWASWEVPIALYVAPSFVANCGFNTLERAKNYWHGYFFVVGERKNSQTTLEYTADQSFYDQVDSIAEGLTKQYTDRSGYGRQRMMTRAAIFLRNCDWRVVAHELGHALGYEHSLVPGSMMYISARIVEEPYMTEDELNLLNYSCE